ncbi:hypothetical protein Tco_0204813 [Tanacetum coccineum]
MRSCIKSSNEMIPYTTKVSRSGTLAGQGSAYNRVLRIWAFLADFRLSCGSALWKLFVLPDSGSVIFSCFYRLPWSLVLSRRFLVLVDEPKLLDTTVGRVVPLLPIAPARAKSELDASVDKLFDEGGSGNLAEQGDSTSGGHGVGIQLVSEAVETIVEDADPVQPRRQQKRKTIVSDAGGPSHPLKKLRQDHKTLSGASIGGKSRCAVQRLLVGAVQNAEVRGEPIPTLPFITSSVSATQEREDEVHTDSTTELNLQTIGAPQRFVISSDSSHHSGANIAEAEVDSFARPFVPLMTVATTVTSTVDPATTVKEKFVESSVFGGDSSGGGTDHTVCGFSDHTGSDFIVGGIRTVISPDTDLQKVYVPQWSVTNGSRLDDGRTCREMVDEFAPPKFFASIRGMEHDQLFTEFNVWAASQMSLSAEVRMRAEYNIRERRRLNSVVEEKNSLLKAMDVEIENEVKVLKEQNATLEQESTDLGVKVANLAALVKVREQEVADLDAQVTFAKSQSDNFAGRDKFYMRLLTTISGRRWLLTHGMKLAIAKSLNSTEYLSILGATIGKAVEKGTQEGLSARITHGAEGRKLTDVATYNPSAEADYLSALQRLQSVNFSLIAELKANKDASIDTIRNLLRLEDTIAKRLGLTESQPHVNQLMPLSAVALEGTEGTSDAVADTTTALSIVVASTSTVRSISVDDYEVTGMDDQATADRNVADEDANPFTNVDDAELNVPE